MPTPPQVILHPSQHHSSRGGAPVVAIVIHATAGTNSLGWLTSNPAGVSAHALISKAGAVYRMVPDERAAHHCGYSRIVRGQALISRATTPNPNQVSLGVELENVNSGRDPYPDAQLAALGWLLTDWSQRHPLARLVLHREIDTQGKSDPAGLTWPTIFAAMAPWHAPAPLLPLFTAESPVLSPSPLPVDALARALVLRCDKGHYTTSEVASLAAIYAALEVESGVNAWLAAAQMCHETGNLTSRRSAPPQRNLAGIGATGGEVPGLSFPSLEAAARAQVGRLLAYALPPAARFGPRQALADEALRWRPLPIPCQGSAPTLRALGAGPNEVQGCGWASPGDGYGAAIAAVANALIARGI